MRANNVILNILQTIIKKGLEPFGIYYSEYRGFVFDNEDPDKMGRLRIVVPEITRDKPMVNWAYPSTFSGSGYGMKVTPQKGDMVWVTFDHGNPNYPIWRFGYFGKGEISEEGLQDIGNHWFITPKGHRVEINDTLESITINCKLSDESLKIVMDSNGISLVRGTKKIYLGGNGSAAEPAVLGDQNEAALNELAGKIDAIYQAISTAAVATDNSGATFKANIIAYLQAQNFPISTVFQTTAQNTKSQQVKTD